MTTMNFEKKVSIPCTSFARESKISLNNFSNTILKKTYTTQLFQFVRLNREKIFTSKRLRVSRQRIETLRLKVDWIVSRSFNFHSQIEFKGLPKTNNFRSVTKFDHFQKINYRVKFCKLIKTCQKQSDKKQSFYEISKKLDIKGLIHKIENIHIKKIYKYCSNLNIKLVVNSYIIQSKFHLIKIKPVTYCWTNQICHNRNTTNFGGLMFTKKIHLFLPGQHWQFQFFENHPVYYSLNIIELLTKQNFINVYTLRNVYFTVLIPQIETVRLNSFKFQWNHYMSSNNFAIFLNQAKLKFKLNNWNVKRVKSTFKRLKNEVRWLSEIKNFQTYFFDCLQFHSLRSFIWESHRVESLRSREWYSIHNRKIAILWIASVNKINGQRSLYVKSSALGLSRAQHAHATEQRSSLVMSELSTVPELKLFLKKKTCQHTNLCPIPSIEILRLSISKYQSFGLILYKILQFKFERSVNKLIRLKSSSINLLNSFFNQKNLYRRIPHKIYLYKFNQNKYLLTSLRLKQVNFALYCISKKLNSKKLVSRPLLILNRFDLKELCNFWNLPLYPDKTNILLKFRRNRLRYQFIPLLRFFFNRQIDRILYQFSEITLIEKFYLDYLTNRLINQHFQELNFYTIDRKMICPKKIELTKKQFYKKKFDQLFLFIIPLGLRKRIFRKLYYNRPCFFK